MCTCDYKFEDWSQDVDSEHVEIEKNGKYENLVIDR